LIARVRSDARLLPFFAVVVALAGLAGRGNATFVQSATYAAIFAIAAIGLSLLLGNANQISLGQAGFFGIGAYTIAYLTTTWNLPVTVGWPLATAIGVALATALGWAIGWITLRFRGHFLAMATLAFGLIFVGLVHESAPLGGVAGIDNIPFAQLGGVVLSGVPAYAFAWAAVFVVALLSLNLLRGRTGWAFEALRNDELAADVCGIPTRRCTMLAFAYAGALAGLAGSMYAAFLGIVVPDEFGAALSIDLLLMVVLGGSGGVAGPIVGAALIGFLDVSGHQFDNWRQVAYGILVIAVVVFAPRGLVGFVPKRFGAPKGGAPAPSAATATLAPVAWPMPDAAAPLEVTGATKRFGGLTAVDDVSFALEPGTLTSLIGPNGAGKTTLFNAICGVGTLSAGSVRVGGTDVTGWNPHRVAGLGVARTFQNARLFAEMTVLENVVIGALRIEAPSFFGDLVRSPGSRRAERAALDRARATLARLGLEALADVPARELAFGDRRRVELARALAADPWLVLVDEPAAGLNEQERRRLNDDLLALRAAGKTVLLIEHDMRLVMSISDRVMVLKFGRLIADGLPAIVQALPDVIEAYLGTPD
jgi:branched-chain amino acid transport system permease protein